MKIELVKQTFDSYGYPDCGFKYKPFEYCCEKLKNNPLIDLIYDLNDEYDSYEDEILPSFSLRLSCTVQSWGDEWEEDVFYKTDYCPFCGEQITLSVTEEEDASEILSNLNKERETVWGRYCKTDSKKKELELKKVVADLDEKINYFHELKEYDESWKEW